MNTGMYTVIAAGVTWLLTELSKSKYMKRVFHKLPARWKRVVPIVLAAGVATGLHQIQSGSSWKDAGWMAVVAAAGAIGINEVAIKGLLGRRS